MNKFLTLLATVVATSIVPATAAFAEPTFPDRSHCDANLTANDPNSRITLRSGPGTDYRNLGYGLVGDRVYVLTNIPPELDYEFDRSMDMVGIASVSPIVVLKAGFAKIYSV